MVQRIADLSTDEFEALVERAVERRLRVWFDQVLDAFGSPDDGDETELRPEFVEALRRSRVEAQCGDTTDLESFRATIGQ